jgi:predicted AlkP superfamily pyrophosphatase or phosphodiesterase
MKNRLAVVLYAVLVITLVFSGCARMQAALPPAPATAATAPQPVPPQAQPGVADFLVLISIDACRPDYFSFSDIPNITSLMKAGVSYDRAWVGQLRNNTPPGHTTMATGAFPRDDGILCFGWRAPSNLLVGMPTSWKNVTNGFMSGLIQRSGATSIGTLFKKAHPGAKVAAISSDKFYAAAGLGAESADYIVFSKSGDATDYEHTANNLLTPAGVQGKLAPADIMNDPELTREKTGKYDSDRWAMDMAIKLFEKEKPQIMLINLPDTDEAGHFSGGINHPEVMGKVISTVDQQIGRLMEEYKKTGVYDRTIWVITSDHGMNPSAHWISQSKINDIVAVSGTKGNEQPEFFLNNQGKAAEVAENIAGANLPGIQGVYYAHRIEAGVNAGGYEYLPSPTTAQSITGDLDKCYRYLTSTYASQKSPDIFIVEAENWRQDYKAFGLWVMPGSHDTVTWDNQWIPMVIAGPGVKQGQVLDSPARLVDIAPTALTLMGITPVHMDGVVLADALAAPTAGQVDAQGAVNRELSPLEKALQARSDADLAATK